MNLKTKIFAPQMIQVAFSETLSDRTLQVIQPDPLHLRGLKITDNSNISIFIFVNIFKAL